MFTEDRKLIIISRDELLTHGITEDHLCNAYNIRPCITFGEPVPYSEELKVAYHRSFVPRFTLVGCTKPSKPTENYTFQIGSKSISYLGVAAGTEAPEIIAAFCDAIKKQAVLWDSFVQHHLKAVTQGYHNLDASVEMSTSVRRRLNGLSIRLMDISVGFPNADLTAYAERSLSSLGYILENMLPKTIASDALELVNAIEISWAKQHGRMGNTLVKSSCHQGGTKLHIVIGDHVDNCVVLNFNRCHLLDKDSLNPTPVFNSVLNDFV